MITFSVWAPTAGRVRVQFDSGGYDLEPADDGWWSADVAAATNGSDYSFLLDEDETPLPDPRSRRQPHGVHGPSQIYLDDFGWTDHQWRGRELSGAVIYELHIGTFTAEGTFDAAAARLDHLVDLGITHVELLPVNAFNGTWNWGYDGVFWSAVHEPYGGPDGLKRFVDACHHRGLAVVLDVVYNHLGPSGNVLPYFGPYFKPGRNTWGDLINLDGPGCEAVRQLIIDNALTWLDEFHLDALRLDAVHALKDSSPVHLLTELSQRVSELSNRTGIVRMLIAESDLNDPVMITPLHDDGFGMTAQWCDDVHHALHSALTGERQGYYVDFGPLSVLAKVLSSAFLHDGTYSTFRARMHGRPVDREHTPGWKFVIALQNHDQVGNRAGGDRLSETLSTRLLQVGATLLLTSPFTPMLWMGEEWGARTPWPFFTSHPEPELGLATGARRIAEFADHGWDVAVMPDPQDPQTYRSAILDWTELSRPPHRQLLDVYRQLITLRAAYPDLADADLSTVQVSYDDDDRWISIERGRFVVIANLSNIDLKLTYPSQHALGEKVVFSTDPANTAHGGSSRVAAESAVIIDRGNP